MLAGLSAIPLLLGAAAVPSEESRVAFTLQDPDILESSGLVLLDDWFVTTNDSGDSGRLFVVDRSGETVGVTHWDDEPRDVEALAAAGPGEVWVGDIGDNRAVRSSIEVTRVPVGPGEREVDDTDTFELVYPDGAQDAETLVSDPATGRLFVVTKGFLGGSAYAAPAELSADEPNPLTPVGTAILPMATDGTVLPDGAHVVVRSYTAAGVYTFPDFEKVATFTLPSQEQGEGITAGPDGALYLSTEGERTDVLRIALPASVREAMSSSGAPPAATAPAADTLPVDQRPGEGLTTRRAVWPWALGGLVGLLMIVVLLRALRPR